MSRFTSYIAALLEGLDAGIFEYRDAPVKVENMPLINVFETACEIEPPLMGQGRYGRSEIEISIYTRDMDDAGRMLQGVTGIIEQTPHPYKSVRIQQVEQSRDSSQDREFILTKVNLSLVYEC